MKTRQVGGVEFCLCPFFLPGLGERPCERGFLVDELNNAVAHTARLDQNDAIAAVEQIAQENLVVQERKERLDSVKDLTLRDAQKLLSGEGRRCRQLRGALLARLCYRELTGGEDLDCGYVVCTPLIDNVEFRQAVDLVAEAIDANAKVFSRWKDVDNPSPHCHLAAVLDLVFAPISRRDEVSDQFCGVNPRSS